MRSFQLGHRDGLSLANLILNGAPLDPLSSQLLRIDRPPIMSRETKLTPDAIQGFFEKCAKDNAQLRDCFDTFKRTTGLSQSQIDHELCSYLLNKFITILDEIKHVSSEDSLKKYQASWQLVCKERMILNDLKYFLGGDDCFSCRMLRNIHHDTDDFIYNHFIPNLIPRESTDYFWIKEYSKCLLPFFKANLAMLTGSYYIAATKPEAVLKASFNLNKTRSISLYINNTPRNKIPEGACKGTFRINFPDNFSIHADPDAVTLVFYNLIKNSLNLAQIRPDNKNPLVEINCSYLDDDWALITLRDNAIGLHDIRTRKFLLQIAEAKEASGEKLDLFDQCILDPSTRFKISPFVLNQMLMRRGTSTQGSTGLGLSMVHQIITDHHGWVELIDVSNKHDPGAMVVMILPRHAEAVDVREARLKLDLKGALAS